MRLFIQGPVTQHHLSKLLLWTKGQELVRTLELKLHQVTEKQQPWL